MARGEVGRLTKDFEGLTTSVQAASKATLKIAKDLGMTATSVDELSTAEKQLIATQMGLAQQQKKATASTQRANAAKKKLRAEIKFLNEELNKSKNIQDLLERGNKIAILGHNKAARAIKAQTKVMIELADASKKGGKEIKKLTRLQKIWAAIKKGGGAVKKVLGGIVGGFKKLTGLVAGAAAAVKKITAIIKATVVAYDSLNYSMKAIIGSATKFGLEMGYMADIIKNFGGDLIQTTKSYIKFKAAADSANLSTKDTQQIFRSVAKASATLGLSNEAMTGTMLALEQMLSKGRLSAEELRRQLGERLPGAYNIMARSIGVTSAELDNMLRKGEILSKDVLPGFARQLEKDYNITAINKVETLGVTIDNTSQRWVDFARTFMAKGSDMYNIVETVYEKLGDLADWMMKKAESGTQTLVRVLSERAALEIREWDKHIDGLLEQTREEQKIAIAAAIKKGESVAAVNRKFQIKEWDIRDEQAGKWTKQAEIDRVKYDELLNQKFESEKTFSERRKLVLAEEIKLEEERGDVELARAKKDARYGKLRNPNIVNYGNREAVQTAYEYFKGSNNDTEVDTAPKRFRDDSKEWGKRKAEDREHDRRLEEIEKKHEAIDKELNTVEANILSIEIEEQRDKTGVSERKAEMVNRDSSKNPNDGGADKKLSAFFKEKELKGAIERTIAAIKVKIKLQKLLGKANYTTADEKKVAMEEQYRLETELEKHVLIKERNKRRAFVKSEQYRLRKTTDRVEQGRKDGKKVTYTYTDSDNNKVTLSTKKQMIMYSKKLEADYREWIEKSNIESNQRIFENEKESAEEIYQMKMTEASKNYVEGQVVDSDSYSKDMTSAESDLLNGSKVDGGKDIKAGSVKALVKYHRETERINNEFTQKSLDSATAYAAKVLSILKSKEGSINKEVSDAASHLESVKKKGSAEEIVIAEETLVAKKILQDEWVDDVKKANTAVIDAERAQSDEDMEIRRERIEKILTDMQNISDITNGLFDVQNALADRALMRLEERHDRELEMHAENVALAEGDADRLEALANEKIVADKRRAKERKKMAIKQAKLDKALAIFNIGIGTAMAVVSALNSKPAGAPALAMALMTGIRGGIELAAAIATPIPRLKDGRVGGDATFAVVGDGGKREVIERNDGSLELTPNTDTLAFLRKGESVYSSREEFDRKRNSQNRGETFSSADSIKDAIKDGFDAVNISNTNNINLEERDLGHELWIMQQAES